MKKKIYSKNMTIGSLKCYRCSKINCKKYYKCVNCDIICCKECLDETNPKRLTYKVFKNDKNGIEKTIYCPLHCSKKNNYCNDCGSQFSNLFSCPSCLINFCTNCQERNMEDIGEFMIPGDYEYNREIKTISSLYCSKSCFQIHYLQNNENYTVCFNCGKIFLDFYGHGNCERCLNLAKVECDVLHNRNRDIYQKEILILISEQKITEEEIDIKVNDYMKDEIEKNDFIEKNNITFKKWLHSVEAGACTCMKFYDNCIIKILKEFDIDVPEDNDGEIGTLIEHIS
jgi:hypothetical protein